PTAPESPLSATSVSPIAATATKLAASPTVRIFPVRSVLCGMFSSEPFLEGAVCERRDRAATLLCRGAEAVVRRMRNDRSYAPASTRLSREKFDCLQIGRVQGLVEVARELAVVAHHRAQAIIHFRCQSQKESHLSLLTFLS